MDRIVRTMDNNISKNSIFNYLYLSAFGNLHHIYTYKNSQ